MIDILSRLEGVSPTREENSYTARCPAHDDRHSSLSVKLTEDKVLLTCHAGCRFDEIVSAMGLPQSDLFADKPKPAAPASKPRRTSTDTYQYTDGAGELLYRKQRYNYDDGSKSFCFFGPDGSKGIKGIKRVPYNLPAVLSADVVYITEGEKACQAVIKAGCVATTLDGGAKSKWYPEYAAYFAGKDVIILPDNDLPGAAYASMLKRSLPNARIIRLPGLPEKGDAYDWLKAGHTMDEIDRLPEHVIPIEATEASEEKAPRIPQAQILIEIVERTGADFFHNDTMTPYAAIPVEEHVEIWPLDESKFKIWLQRLYYRETGKPVGNEAVGQAVAVLSGKALFERPNPFTLSTRLAQPIAGVIWYDLTNPLWQAVRIAPEGWKIIDEPPILFNRYNHQAGQVMPQPGGDVRRILQHINLKDNHTLFLCWLVSCFIPGIPHTMPIFYGEKGAAKSTTCGILKTLIDPSNLETLTLQNDPRTLAVNLQQHWFLPFDNVSHINEETSDTLCRAITGGGIQQRKLFTNAEDVIFSFKRCLAVNGINNVATRPDLLDRSLLIELERITTDKRRELADIHAAFKADLPAILGGVFDTLVKAMHIFPAAKLSNLPRMADFAKWGYAIGEALGGLGQEFLDQYADNQKSQNTEAINADPVATLIVAFMKDRTFWEGRASDLLKELGDIAYQHGINIRSKSFPQQPNRLSRRLRGMKSNLEAVGIMYGNEGHGKTGTTLSLKVAKSSSLSSPSSQPLCRNDYSGDDQVTISDGKNSSSPLPSPLNPLWHSPGDDGDDQSEIPRGDTSDLYDVVV